MLLPEAFLQQACSLNAGLERSSGLISFSDSLNRVITFFWNAPLPLQFQWFGCRSDNGT